MFLSSVIAKSKGFLVLGEYTEALKGLNPYKLRNRIKVVGTKST